MCSKWNPSVNQLHQGSKHTYITKKTPSRFRRNAKRLQAFLEKKVQSSKDSLDSQQPGSPVACDSLKDPVQLLNNSSVIPSSSISVPAEVHSLHGDADVKICSSPKESALQVAIAAQPGNNSLHSPPTPEPGKSDITISRTQSSDCSPTGNSPGALRLQASEAIAIHCRLNQPWCFSKFSAFIPTWHPFKFARTGFCSMA